MGIRARTATLIMSILTSGVSGKGMPELSFPPGFRWGAATSAYQVEGAWNASDKSQSIWDVFTHEHPEKIADGNNGDVACDSYHLWERDIEMAKEMGLDFYRFSISWPRLLPSGFPDHISEDGQRYYDNLIQGLLDNGIEPIPTLYHWDMPQRLQDMGGWTNPLIADWFAAYARVVFTLYGNRVKTWLTINEPLIICSFAHGTNIMPPGLNDPLIAKYLCDKNVVMAHAKAYRVYQKEFKQKYHGKLSLANQLLWFEPASPQHEEITEILRQFSHGIYCHPIFSKKGGWPAEVVKVVEDNSRREGYPTSRLPDFTEAEKALARGSFDFFGLNYYASKSIRKFNSSLTDNSTVVTALGSAEVNAMLEGRADWPQGASSWFSVHPRGLRSILRWIKQSYGEFGILITENGFSGSKMDLDDKLRVKYYKDHLLQVLLSIKQDNVNVIGYTAWSLMDNFEWVDGYSVNFGLYSVNFTSPQHERTPRLSARYYAKIIHEHSLDVANVPEILNYS